jgi:ribosomal protein S17E
MKIEDISAIKVCDISLNEKSTDRRLWDINWVTGMNNILTQNNGRCYFIVVNGEIYKIGYSDQIGGIKATIESYKSCGNSGRPSDRTHGVHVLIAEELVKGSSVEFYFTYNENIEVELTLMDGTTKSISNSISGKILETENMKIFLSVEGVHPIWNLQEAGKPWPEYLQESRRILLTGVPTTLDIIRQRILPGIREENLNQLDIE